IRWHYIRTRSKAASPEIIVAFERGATGEWRRSTDPKMIDAEYSRISTDPSRDTTFGHREQRTMEDRVTALSAGTAGSVGIAPTMRNAVDSLEAQTETAKAALALDTVVFAN